MVNKKIDKDMLINHYDVLGAFNSEYYKDLITKDHLGEETVITQNGKQIFIYPVKYKGKIFAIKSDVVEQNKLPIKVTKAVKIAYNRNVYHYVKSYDSFKIMPEKAYDFRQLIKTLGNFKHSKDDDFTIFKIANVILYLRKGFMRTVSEAAFGKNSINNILKILMTDTAIINPRSIAVFEHKLINKLIVLDELTNLEKNQRDLMQESLLRVADGSPTYEKSTRASKKMGTKDEYDISKLSVLILYNIYEYYVSCGQGDKYFDNVFQHAVKDRFFPMKCEGVLDTTQFIDIVNPKFYADYYKDDIKQLIRTLKYYQLNLETEIKPYNSINNYILSKTGRQDKTFRMICQGLNLYAKDEEEFNSLVKKLFDMHKKYNSMIAENSLEEVELNEPIKPKDQQKLC